MFLRGVWQGRARILTEVEMMTATFATSAGFWRRWRHVIPEFDGEALGGNGVGGRVFDRS
jgi:hypothetical protein